MKVLDGNALEGVSEDLTFCEILPRLPMKLLFRFKLVCKRWSDLITPNNKLLAHRHHSLNCMNLSSIGFYFDSPIVMTMTINSNCWNPISWTFIAMLKVQSMDYFMASVLGLVIETFICNPITKQVVRVPNPNNRYHIALVVDNHYNRQFGFVIIAIVKMQDAVTFEVYSSKAKEWRSSNAEIQAPSLNPNLQIPFQERVRKFNPIFKVIENSTVAGLFQSRQHCLALSPYKVYYRS
ncbi:hypothetical protein Sjap_025813 [Stephania japonica]|uniref:F-box domain-containing protein n=1 Tax=Stephania japonica TaxID=461633 RepID=A0AAP0E5V5_9MAGN